MSLCACVPAHCKCIVPAAHSILGNRNNASKDSNGAPKTTSTLTEHTSAAELEALKSALQAAGAKVHMCVCVCVYVHV